MSEQADAVQEQEAAPVAVGKKAKGASTGNLILDIASEVEKYSKTKALNEADHLVKDIDENSFKLGGILKLISENSWYDGADSFGVFVYERYGFAERKARYLIQIYNDLVTKQIPWEKVAKLGWTKLKDLAAILTVDNVDEWVAKAELMTVVQLQAALKASMPAEDGTTKPTDEFQKFGTYKLKADQAATVTAAINKGKAELGTEFDSVVLENICAAYVGGNVNVSAPDPVALLKSMGWSDAIQAWCTAFPEIDITIDEKTVPA